MDATDRNKGIVYLSRDLSSRKIICPDEVHVTVCWVASRGIVLLVHVPCVSLNSRMLVLFCIGQSSRIIQKRFS
jgi:hypothetical protein